MTWTSCTMYSIYDMNIFYNVLYTCIYDVNIFYNARYIRREHLLQCTVYIWREQYWTSFIMFCICMTWTTFTMYCIHMTWTSFTMYCIYEVNSWYNVLYIWSEQLVQCTVYMKWTARQYFYNSLTVKWRDWTNKVE